MKTVLPVIVLAATGLSSCTEVVLKPSSSASETAKNYYLVLNSGTAEEIDAFESKEYKGKWALLPNSPSNTGYFDIVSKNVSKEHTITGIDIISVAYPSYGASVTIRIHYRDGSTANYNADMTLEDHVWKMLWY